MAKDKGKRRLYRIGEAATALKLKTCVLRFWEGEFPQLEPLRTPKGQRLYREEDMRLLRRIRSLLHEKGMTIDGARRVLSGEMGLPSPRPLSPTVSVTVEENVTVVSPATPSRPSVPPPSSSLSALSPEQVSRLAVPPAGRAAIQASESQRLLEDVLCELREVRGVLSRLPALQKPELES